MTMFSSPPARAFVGGVEIVDRGLAPVLGRLSRGRRRGRAVGKVLRDPALGDAVRDLDQGALGVAVEQ